MNPGFTILGSRVLFAGEDASGNANLWVSDGTAAGTSELVVAGAYSGGLKPSDITVLGNGKAVFQGADSSGNINLWITDGTAAGTSEVAVPAANPAGLNPSDITVLTPPPTADFNGDGKSDILFQNANGPIDIWTMNGTTPATEVLVQNLDASWHAIGTGDFNGDGKADITGRIAQNGQWWSGLSTGTIGGLALRKWRGFRRFQRTSSTSAVGSRFSAKLAMLSRAF